MLSIYLHIDMDVTAKANPEQHTPINIHKHAEHIPDDLVFGQPCMN